MCDDQLRFFLLPILLSRRPKSWIFSSSPIFDKSQISLFSWASCTRPTSFAWLSGRTLSLLQLECSREEECLVRAKNFSAHNPQLFSFFFFINGSSKESKPSEAHPRIFFLSLLLLPMTCVNPFELFFTDSFFFFSSSKSPCGNFDYLTGFLHEAMSSVWKLRRKSLKMLFFFFCLIVGMICSGRM